MLERTWRFRRLSDAQAVLGESPVWSARDGCVWWVDVTGRRLLRSDAANGATRVWRTPEEIGFVALSQVINKKEGSRWIVPANLYPAIAQDAVLLKTGANNEAARAFVAFLKGKEARTVKEKYGYGAID